MVKMAEEVARATHHNYDTILNIIPGIVYFRTVNYPLNVNGIEKCFY